jgi:hypothetical protein
MMKILIITWTACLLLSSTKLYAQTVTLSRHKLDANQVSLSKVKLMGKEAVRVIKDTAVKGVDEPTFALLKGIDFTDGTIEVKVLSRLLKTAPDFARGFIGIAFRINDSNTKYESIYIRPTNGRADDQVRRNHSIQYYSYPDYKFDRLRKESPEKYESYSDMALNQWITMRIEVKGSHAKLFLNNNKQPSLVVNELKHGANASGAIGLWVEIGTEGYFTDLKISKQ